MFPLTRWIDHHLAGSYRLYPSSRSIALVDSILQLGSLLQLRLQPGLRHKCLHMTRLIQSHCITHIYDFKQSPGVHLKRLIGCKV